MKMRVYSWARICQVFALSTSLDLIMAGLCALAGVMNFAWAQGKVTLLVLWVFHLEAFSISPPCHHLNYLTASLIQRSAAPARSGQLHRKLRTFFRRRRRNRRTDQLTWKVWKAAFRQTGLQTERQTDKPCVLQWECRTCIFTPCSLS